MLYVSLLIAHNLMRWVVLASALWALLRTYRGWLAERAWDQRDRRAGTFFSMTVDVQLLLGIALSFLSPRVRYEWGNLGSIFAGGGEGMLILVEHIPLMLLAVVAVHVTSVLARRGESDRSKHRRAAIGYSLSVLAVLVGIPWARPLLRLLG